MISLIMFRHILAPCLESSPGRAFSGAYVAAQAAQDTGSGQRNDADRPGRVWPRDQCRFVRGMSSVKDIDQLRWL